MYALNGIVRADTTVIPFPDNRSRLQTKETALFFTEEDIRKMPKTFRNEFRVDGCTSHIRERKSGKNTISYEIRYRRNGYNITVSSTNKSVAKERFIEALRTAVKTDGAPKLPNTFQGFAEYFFENFYKRKVKPETLRIALSQYKNHMKPCFGAIALKRITPALCQTLLDKLKSAGMGKTADDIHSLLNLIFKAAVKHNLINNNPLDMVFHTQHEREHGTALSKEEEKLLIDTTAGTPLQLMFVVPLYTGMRPYEYASAQIEGEFIVAINGKQKNGKVVYKKIPITPMLRPYLEGVTELKFFSLRVLRGRFAKILPNHKLYDLRTTFYTRCQECEISDVARKTFVGHSLGVLENTYTDLSDEFLLSEGEKFRY